MNWSSLNEAIFGHAQTWRPQPDCSVEPTRDEAASETATTAIARISAAQPEQPTRPRSFGFRFLHKDGMRLALLTLVLATLVPFSSLGAVWTSADGRYVAPFPNAPVEREIVSPEATGVAYTLIDTSTDWPLSYSVVVLSPSALRSVPPDSQIRSILDMSFKVFADSVDASAESIELRWAAIGNSDPRLDYTMRYENSDLVVESRGFMFMDGLSMLRVSVSYPVGAPPSAAKAVDQFLSMFVVIRPKKDVQTELDYIRKLVVGSGGIGYACSDSLEMSLRSSFEQRGGSLLGVACFYFADEPASVVAKLDKQRSDLSELGTRGPWRDTGSGGVLQTTKVGDIGIGLLVLPAAAMLPDDLRDKGVTYVVAQIVK